MEEKIKIIKKDGRFEDYDSKKIYNAVKKSALRVCVEFTEDELNTLNNEVLRRIHLKIKKFNKLDGYVLIPVAEIHNIVGQSLKVVNEEVALSYKEYRDFKTERAKDFKEVLDECDSISLVGDKSNANADDRLVTTKAFLDSSAFSKKRFFHYFLTPAEREAHNEGYIYIHDLNRRLYTFNCCVFNIKKVFEGGFEMGNIKHYNEPKSLDVAFNVLGDLILSTSSQQYGGFTVPEVDKFLLKYAQMSYDSLYKKYCDLFNKTKNMYQKTITAKGVEIPTLLSDVESSILTPAEEPDDAIKKMAHDEAMKDVKKMFRQGFQGIECMLNSCANAKGDYSFVSFTFGLGTSELERMCNETILEVRMAGQGAPGKKQTVLFPKLIFLYDHKLHGEGGELESIFNLAIKCSSKCAYPDYNPVDVNSNEEIVKIYKEWGMPLSQMGCRSAVGPFYESGNWYPTSENDAPVMVGRFNLGVVSLNLIMILARAKEMVGEDEQNNKKAIRKQFYALLDHYLEMIRQIHIKTYLYLKDMRASMDPLAFCEGGLWHGNLKPNDKIEPCLKAATYSFGITGLNELEQLWHQKSLVQDGSFALSVMEYINKKVKEFKYADGKAYSIYGTPAESLSQRQVQQFRKRFGTIENVSDREYVSNSFHCHVSEEITQIEKQDYEKRFWPYFEGGRIQYVRYDADYNLKAMTKITRRACDLGFYNGINISKSFCNDCGNEMINEKCTCPKCGSHNLTVIERVCGYLGYYKTNETETRMNSGKIAEIDDRKSM